MYSLSRYQCHMLYLVLGYVQHSMSHAAPCPGLCTALYVTCCTLSWVMYSKLCHMLYLVLGYVQHSMSHAVPCPGLCTALYVICCTFSWVMYSTLCHMLYLVLGYVQHSMSHAVPCPGLCTALYVTCCTLSWVMYSGHMVNDAICIDISVRRVEGGEREAAQRPALIQVHHFHTLM